MCFIARHPHSCGRNRWLFKEHCVLYLYQDHMVFIVLFIRNTHARAEVEQRNPPFHNVGLFV